MRLLFDRLLWQPRWHRRHESFWSVLMKLAHANGESTLDVSKYWGKALDTHRISTLLPTPEFAALIARDLALVAPQRHELFAGVWTGALEQREAYRLGFRWCPECAKHWFHSPLFQESRRARCPWHGSLLASRCVCRATIDVLSPEPWKCAQCGAHLAPHTGAWPKVFSRGLPQERMSSLPDEFLYQASPLPGGSLEYTLCDPTFEESREQNRLFDGSLLLADVAFEESSALVDALIGVHRECVMDVWVHWQGFDLAFESECPVAAAVVALAEFAGCNTEVVSRTLRGSRFRQPVTRHSRRASEDAPRWLAPLVVREMIRGALASALRQFNASVEQGYCELRLRPLPPCYPEFQMLASNKGVIWPVVSEAELLGDVSAGHVLCPRFGTGPRGRLVRRPVLRQRLG